MQIYRIYQIKNLLIFCITYLHALYEHTQQHLSLGLMFHTIQYYMHLLIFYNKYLLITHRATKVLIYFKGVVDTSSIIVIHLFMSMYVYVCLYYHYS